MINSTSKNIKLDSSRAAVTCALSHVISYETDLKDQIIGAYY